MNSVEDIMSSAGLAHDALSAENAVAIMLAERPPLILDPSGQASLWLQARLKAKGTNHEVVQMHSDRSAAANLAACSFMPVFCFWGLFPQTTDTGLVERSVLGTVRPVSVVLECALCYAATAK